MPTCPAKPSCEKNRVRAVVVLAFAFYGGVVLLLDAGCWREDRELPITPALPVWVRGLAYAAAFLFLSFIGESDVAPFIYFQF